MQALAGEYGLTWDQWDELERRGRAFADREGLPQDTALDALKCAIRGEWELLEMATRRSLSDRLAGVEPGWTEQHKAQARYAALREEVV